MDQFSLVHDEVLSDVSSAYLWHTVGLLRSSVTKADGNHSHSCHGPDTDSLCPSSLFLSISVHLSFYLQVCACSVVSNSCDPIDCNLPGSSVHRILQARILEWVAISSSRGSSSPRDRTCMSSVSCTTGRFAEPSGKFHLQVRSTQSRLLIQCTKWPARLSAHSLSFSKLSQAGKLPLGIEQYQPGGWDHAGNLKQAVILRFFIPLWNKIKENKTS